MSTPAIETGLEQYSCNIHTSSSAVTKRPRDASCLSVVSFNSTKRPAKSFITFNKGGGICFCLCLFVCLSVSLLERLLKNACMDLDEMFRVDICRDMDELINF